MDLMTMWKQARGEVALPAGEVQAFDRRSGVALVRYTSQDMRAIATPDPETLKRFAEMVAEEVRASGPRLRPWRPAIRRRYPSPCEGGVMGTTTGKEAADAVAQFAQEIAEGKHVPAWWHCPTHGPGTVNAWGCPECVREMRAELAALRKRAEEAEAIAKAARRALAAWDETVLPVAQDGMMQERMEDLRAAIDAARKEET